MLLDRLKDGESTDVCPIGAAIVRAAADCRRAGFVHPLAQALLEQLYPVYLEDQFFTADGSMTVEEAINWACQPLGGVTALLERHEKGFTAFDYIVEHFERHGHDHPIPPATWEAVLNVAADRADRLAVGIAAVTAGKLEVAEQALRPIADGDPNAAFNLGLLCAEREDVKATEYWYERAASAGHMAAMWKLGRLLEERHRLSAAERWYRQAADQQDNDAMYWLSKLLSQQERHEEAMHWSERAAEPVLWRGYKVMHRHEAWQESERWLRRAAEDHQRADAMYVLAVLAEGRGDAAEAKQWYKHAAKLNDYNAQNNLGSLLLEDHNGLSQENAEEGELWLRRAAEAGHSAAGALLGIYLMKTGRDEEAERWQHIRGGKLIFGLHIPIVATIPPGRGIPMMHMEHDPTAGVLSIGLRRVGLSRYLLCQLRDLAARLTLFRRG